MRLLGITGGIGMGKSTSGSLLSLEGVPVIDTDVIARELMAKEAPAWRDVVSTFGAEILLPSGEIDRPRLASIVFNDANALAQLEAILHPKIRMVWSAKRDEWRAAGSRIAAVIIPLLFETDCRAEFAATVAVACKPSTQWNRLAARGWTAQEISAREKAQWSVGRKIEASDYVVWTDGPLERHRDQLRRLVQGK